VFVCGTMLNYAMNGEDNSLYPSPHTQFVCKILQESKEAKKVRWLHISLTGVELTPLPCMQQQITPNCVELSTKTGQKVT
jgi:hypothetical protein